MVVRVTTVPSGGSSFVKLVLVVFTMHAAVRVIACILIPSFSRFGLANEAFNTSVWKNRSILL
jgi:hypothetical protein